MDPVLVPYIKNIKYKGFHPTEKKKTIEKINLLIKKYNTFYKNFFGYGLGSENIKNTLVAEGSNDRKIKELLGRNGLKGCFQIGLSYVHNNKKNIDDEMNKIETDFKKNFENSLDRLKNSGKDLKTINQDIEKNDFWEIYTVVGENHLKIKNPEYENFEEEMKNIVENKIQSCNVTMINVFKNYVTGKEERKLKEIPNFLKTTILGLENEIFKDLSLKEEMEKVIKALNTIIKIVDPSKKSNDSLTEKQINLLNECFKNMRGFEELIQTDEDTLKEKYFLPTINSDKKTKKTIFALISALTDSPNKRDFRKIITDSVKERVKNANTTTNPTAPTKNSIQKA